MSGPDYKQLLKQAGLLKDAEKWLKKYQKPDNWQGCKWSYAYTEMPTGWAAWVERVFS